ncbi:MAG: phage integrase SAM-like domain-containing protein, partial [Pirellulaceae bacterium]|nr:phage integrase SAM-like domain-containing protein [Pirellulaceae bacterium]
MASVTAEKRNGRTLYRIEYRDKDKRRKKLRLGSVAKRDAEAIASKVQSIVSSQTSGNDLAVPTAQWLATIGDELYQRLAEQGLCKPRLQYSLHDWLDQFIKKHGPKVGDRCLLNLGQAQALLERHFGPERSLKEISVEDAAGFRAWLTEEGYAQATIAGHIKKSKQFFSEAVKVGAIKQNPFESVDAGTQHNDERSLYVTAETIEKVIAKAPDAQWRLIIALSRYAGLRCPSETLAMRWADVDFVNG